jgi:hypothetical protein
MNYQKNQKMGMGMSLQITQKPQLLQCSESSCYQCYEMYQDGFFCPVFKVKDVFLDPAFVEPKYPEDISLI